MNSHHVGGPAKFSGSEYSTHGRSERLATLGLMTAGVAHDLGNHLQVAAAAIHLLEQSVERSADPEIRARAEGVSAALQRAAALSRRIVDFSRGQNGVADHVNIDEALLAMSDALRWTAAPYARLRLDLAGGAAVVQCDLRDLENALLNLVANARDASQDGGLITVAVRRDPHSPSVLVAVRDEGCGMTLEAAQRAFDPFFTTRPADGGAGLGLARVADFARRAGGEASLRSVPGSGTIVLLRLPEAPPTRTEAS